MPLSTFRYLGRFGNKEDERDERGRKAKGLEQKDLCLLQDNLKQKSISDLDLSPSPLPGMHKIQSHGSTEFPISRRANFRYRFILYRRTRRNDIACSHSQNQLSIGVQGMPSKCRGQVEVGPLRFFGVTVSQFVPGFDQRIYPFHTLSVTQSMPSLFETAAEAVFVPLSKTMRQSSICPFKSASAVRPL